MILCHLGAMILKMLLSWDLRLGSTSIKFSCSPSVSDAGRKANDALTTFSNEMKEFEQRGHPLFVEVQKCWRIDKSHDKVIVIINSFFWGVFIFIFLYLAILLKRLIKLLPLCYFWQGNEIVVYLPILLHGGSIIGCA